METLAAGLPSSAPSSPRLALSRRDSCGLSIAGEVSCAVLTGAVGLDMSSTTTPRPVVACISVSLGNSSVES